MSEGQRDSGAAGQRESLRAAIERYAGDVPAGEERSALEAFKRLMAGLNAGTVRAAERAADGRWRANAWVKRGILLGFRLGRITGSGRG